MGDRDQLPIPETPQHTTPRSRAGRRVRENWKVRGMGSRQRDECDSVHRSAIINTADSASWLPTRGTLAWNTGLAGACWGWLGLAEGG